MLQLVEYEKVLYFDGDLLFHKNVDYLFYYDYEFIGRKSSKGPLNGGLYVVRPSLQSLNDMVDAAMSQAFTVEDGWMGYGPAPDWRLAMSYAQANWTFFCASSDQGIVGSGSVP